MERLIASTFIGKGSLWLSIDDEVVIQNNDTTTIELAANETYFVHWFVKGNPGGSYSITITAPKEAQIQITRGIGKSGKDFGSLQFKI